MSDKPIKGPGGRKEMFRKLSKHDLETWLPLHQPAEINDICWIEAFIDILRESRGEETAQLWQLLYEARQCEKVEDRSKKVADIVVQLDTGLVEMDTDLQRNLRVDRPLEREELDDVFQQFCETLKNNRADLDREVQEVINEKSLQTRTSLEQVSIWFSSPLVLLTAHMLFVNPVCLHKIF
jgi:transcription termination factor NusB